MYVKMMCLSWKSVSVLLPGLKTKIFHVERLSESPVIQRYLKSERRKIFEEEEAQKQDFENNDLDEIIDGESKVSNGILSFCI